MLTLAISDEKTHAIFDSLEHLRGFVLVVIILLALWGLTAAIGRTFLALEARKKEAKRHAVAAPPSALPPAPASSDDHSDEEIAAVAAAVSLLMEGPHRILAIRPTSADWGREGRRQIFASHQIR